MGSAVFPVFYINQKTSLHIKIKKRYGFTKILPPTKQLTTLVLSRAMTTTTLLVEA